MDRLLIERIEGRVVLGITMFVAIMILIGWVAINEPARMAAFERQHLGRSIERGAELFASNCSTCHAADGRGIAERAPGLNSPHFFGYNFISDINNDVARLQRQIDELNAQVADLTTERDDLRVEIVDATEERQAEIITRIGEIDEQLNAELEDSLPARITALEEEVAPLVQERDLQIDTLQPAMDRNYLPEFERVLTQAEQNENPLLLTNYIAEDAERLSQAGWEGDLRSFITTTLYHGRPGSQDAWGGNQMVAWGQVGGGPLRTDQVEDIVNYIMNWDKGDQWTLEDLYGVQQFAKIKADAAFVSDGGSDIPAVGTNVDEITLALASLEGDAARGEQLYNGDTRTELRQRLACSSCHLGGAQAPATEVTWDNVVNIRLNEGQFSGYTAEQYLAESIVAPNDYVVEGYASGVMPQQYSEQMSVQDMADIIAYLQSYSE
jgi:mono/diheme cytochrome c family protein/outer membrane murein-binding lipoprotein Lpp